MGDTMTVAAMLQTLQGQIEEHRSQEAFHAERELHHRDERARHAVELERVTQRYEALEAAVAGAEQVLRIPEPSAPQPPDDSDLGERPKASRALARVLAAWPAGSAFGPSQIAAEVNRRFAGKLKKPVDSRAASLYLRRRSREGTIDGLREGKAYHEAQYRKRD